MTWKSRWWIRLGTAIGIACVIGAGIAFATIPDGSGVIHGCYTKSTGTIRVIDSAATDCKSGETTLNWNTTGPMGPAGPAGPPGPAGPAGQQGDRGDDNVIALGVSGLSATKTVTVTDLGDVTVTCDADGVSTSGVTTPNSLQFREDRQRSDGSVVTSFGNVTGGITDRLPLNSASIVTYQIDKPGIGMWMVQFNLEGRASDSECVSTAVITAMQ